MKKQAYTTQRNPSFIGRIGISTEDVTPPEGIYARNWGAASHDIAEGLHRPLKLVCQTFQSDEDADPLVLISIDWGWWKNFEDEAFFRKGILNALSLQPAQLMICLSHTHAGPSISRQDISKPGGEHIQPYLINTQLKAVSAIKNALLTAFSGTLTWHHGKCALACNRDLPETGTDRIVVGFNPESEADDTLLVGRITDDSDNIKATIVNYACHPTTLGWDNRLISPDYVGPMRELIESRTNAPCLFLQGASGELAPAQQYGRDLTIAEMHGRQLGYAVLATLEAMLPPATELSFIKVVESGAPLAVWHQTDCQTSTTILSEMAQVEFPLKPLPSLSEIEQQWEECEDRVMKERLWRKLNIRKAIGDGEKACVPLWIWRLGDSFLIGQPNEAYSQLQLELRKYLAPFAVGVINVVNGHIGYLPTQQFYERDIYSAWQTPFAKGSLELLIQTSKSISKQMIQ